MVQSEQWRHGAWSFTILDCRKKIPTMATIPFSYFK